MSSLKKPLGNGSVLIDTWWNVNIAVMSVAVTRIIVLIDTWWNVNDETGVFITALGASFNRYMVECE